MDEIDDAIDRLNKHQQAIQKELNAGSNQRLQFSQPRYPNGMRKATPSLQLDKRILDRLMLTGIDRANKLMDTVKHLNEALDEFEDQFNFPRFEPNSIDDYLKDTEL